MARYCSSRHLCLVIALTFFALGGCSFFLGNSVDRALSFERSGNPTRALEIIRAVLLTAKDTEERARAAREGARIAMFVQKDYREAAGFNSELILNSSDPKERLQAQMQLSSIYLDQLVDYPAAVREINRLLPKLRDPTERAAFRLSLARAYFYMNNFEQADDEASQILMGPTDPDDRFHALLLRGNTALARKSVEKASGFFRQALAEFPERSERENVAITLAVAYEEIKDFKSAISALEEAKIRHPNPDLLEIRIQRLKARQKQQPGARGLRK